MAGLYTEILTSKTGMPVPCFSNASTVYSRYNPERECELFASDDCFLQADFYVIGGIGTGLHLSALQKKHPHAHIIAVEQDVETLSFLQNSGYLPHQNENLILTDISSLESTIVQNYLPALHGNFCMKSLRSWENALDSCKKSQLELAVSNALTIIKRDYGVQAHFGKLWNRNILENLQLWCTLEQDKSAVHWSNANPQNLKTCTVFAAGPTLTKALSNSTETPFQNHYLISVDTALPVLLKHHIIPHMVVTIDPQIASMRHFHNLTESELSNTILASDLCGTPGAARIWAENHWPVLFFNQNHPLGTYFSQYIAPNQQVFLNISAGAGTVTHSAVELAYALGFENVQLIGADFSFPGNMPYAKGTYLEDSWVCSSTRTAPLEHAYDTLLFRTPLLTDAVTQAKTTAVLASYREALEQRLVELQKKKPRYSADTNLKKTGISVHSETYVWFIESYLTGLKNNEKKAVISSLPLMAYLKSKGNNSDTETKDVVISSVKRHLSK